MTLKSGKLNLEEIVERTEVAAKRRRGPPMTFVVKTSGIRLRVISWVSQGGEEGVLESHHRDGGTFPVYLVPIGEGYKSSGEVTEVRAWPPQRPGKSAGTDRYEQQVVSHPD